MTQKEMIIKYMQDFGTISPWQAFADLGCTKLSTRIGEIMKDGVPIHKEKVFTKNRYGKRCSYKIYSLGEAYVGNQVD